MFEEPEVQECTNVESNSKTNEISDPEGDQVVLDHHTEETSS